MMGSPYVFPFPVFSPNYSNFPFGPFTPCQITIPVEGTSTPESVLPSPFVQPASSSWTYTPLQGAARRNKAAPQLIDLEEDTAEPQASFRDVKRCHEVLQPSTAPRPSSLSNPSTTGSEEVFVARPVAPQTSGQKAVKTEKLKMEPHEKSDNPTLSSISLNPEDTTNEYDEPSSSPDNSHSSVPKKTRTVTEATKILKELDRLSKSVCKRARAEGVDVSCVLCPKKFPSIGFYVHQDSHVSSHFKTGSSQCSLCGKIGSSAAIRLHLWKTHQERSAPEPLSDVIAARKHLEAFKSTFISSTFDDRAQFPAGGIECKLCSHLVPEKAEPIKYEDQMKHAKLHRTLSSNPISELMKECFGDSGTDQPSGNLDRKLSGMSVGEKGNRKTSKTQAVKESSQIPRRRRMIRSSAAEDVRCRECSEAVPARRWKLEAHVVNHFSIKERRCHLCDYEGKRPSVLQHFYRKHPNQDSSQIIQLKKGEKKLRKAMKQCFDIEV